MILHEFALSSASYRVRIALNLKGLAYKSRTYKLRLGEQRAPDYLALNPAGLVPTLEVNGRRISQSLAIIDYLDAIHPEPRLIPADPEERARALEIAMTIACDIHPINNLRVLLYLEQRLEQDKPAVDAWYSHWVSHGFAALEAMLAETPGQPFAGGEAPGLADVHIVPQVFNARRNAVDLNPYPRLIEIADRAAGLPAFAAAAPGAVG
jgi:maleylacetoacetate isomerase/maleylpyruvate isomerase